ncbi:MAG: YfcE family phosphodiesterase [Oscillospiraceae bacterium]|nr:YfcE family phosphodiesterase [Oscillospiraceae bacterium]
MKKVTTIRLLIYSDAHGHTNPMLAAVEREHPDEVLYLGDCMRDFDHLRRAFPSLAAQAVPGNCDGPTALESTLLLEREGVRLLLGHGHRWQVKVGLEQALCAAQCAQADVLLFGHTHQALCERRGNLWLLNPGTVGGVGAPPSYGLVRIEGETVTCQVKWCKR